MTEIETTVIPQTFYSGSGLDASKPDPATLRTGAVYYATDTGKMYQVQAAAWVVVFYSGSGLDASKPAASGLNPGALYHATDTGKIYQVQAAAWVTIFDPANIPAGSGTVTTQAFGDAAVAGSASAYSKGDHKHGMPANPLNDVKVSKGSYSGTSTANRAIAHGLGVTPTLVFILDLNGVGSYNFVIVQTGASVWMSVFLGTQASGGAVTNMDSTNFYVGNSANYYNSANFSGRSYIWVAIG